MHHSDTILAHDVPAMTHRLIAAINAGNVPPALLREASDLLYQCDGWSVFSAAEERNVAALRRALARAEG